MLDFMKNASDCYYRGEPILTDEEFDHLAKLYNYDDVGHRVTDGLPHLYKMYSLQKCFDIADAPVDISKCIETPKLDGAAVSLLYANGILALALTRGDGNLGRDITDKMRTLVPNRIECGGNLQVTGEVVCPSRVPNARNVAAGSLNLKDFYEFHARPLSFVAYDAVGERTFFLEWVDTLQFLKESGFNTVTTFNASNYPTDGLVYRINDNVEFTKLGYTAHHPRGAFALKEQKEGVVTELLDVVWQVGKSGVVSPVAILEPVEVGEAIVSRATLHNIEYIRSLNLELGCRVEIIRSGEIIPRIVRRVDLEKNSS